MEFGVTASVDIYTRASCGYCDRAKALLGRKGVAFREIDAGSDRDAKHEMVVRSRGGSTFPQIFIDGRHVGGSDDLYALEARGELDRLLHPAGA
jgi:glutaredoxin 3